MMQKISNFSKKEKGQGLLELALSFTFLLLIVSGIVDIGRMFYTFVALRDSAQEGAIYGSYNPSDTNGIRDRITRSASFPIEASQITNIVIRCSGGTCGTASITSCQGQPISVQILYDYDLIMPLIGGVIGSQTVPLDATVTSTILESGPTIANLKTLNQTCP